MAALAGRIESDYFGFIVAPHHLAALGESCADCIRSLGKGVFSCYLWDIGFPGYLDLMCLPRLPALVEDFSRLK